MQLHLKSCADELDLLICNQSSSNPCQGSGSSRPPPAERGSTCGAGPNSRVSVKNSDLMMSTPASRENSATMAAACTIGSWSNPSPDLNDSLHAPVNRQDESPISSRQSRMIFSTTSGAAVDHERGGWCPRCYACSFCGREFNSAQALGGHMNIHRRDRARLRTSTSPASTPHDQADLPPILQNTIQYPAPSSLYDSFNEAAFRENPNTAISSSFNVSYSAPNIFSATPATFNLLDIQPAAPEPSDLRALAAAACPSPADENLAAPFSVPLVDLVPFGSTHNSSSATRFSNEAHSLFSNIAPHASPLFGRTRVENSSPKHVEALNMSAGQASASHVDCEAGNRAQLIQFSQSKFGRAKRAREDDAVDGATDKPTAGQRCRQKQSSGEKSNSLHASRAFVRPSTPDVKGLLCLDLELRLGQSSLSDSDGAGACCRPWTTATAAPRPPA